MQNYENTPYIVQTYTQHKNGRHQQKRCREAKIKQTLSNKKVLGGKNPKNTKTQKTKINSSKVGSQCERIR